MLLSVEIRMFVRLAWRLNFSVIIAALKSEAPLNQLTEPTHRHGSGVINIDTLNFLHYTIHSSKIPISCDVSAEI